jgi:transcriptional regulator with XRE-family HTH domain
VAEVRRREKPLDSRAVEYAHLGQWLKEQREKAGVGLREAARRLDRPPSYIYRIESGKQRLDLLHFADMVRVLGIEPSLTFAELIKALDGSGDGH